MELAMHEIPLAIFSTLAPIGAGTFFMLALSFCYGNLSEEHMRRIDKMTIIPLLVALIGLIASFFHLANPMHALNVANTIGTTPLANEITAFGVFMIVAAIYWIVALCGGLKSDSARRGFALVTGILGLIASIFIGCAYLIDTIPSWNTFWSPVAVLGFALMGGTILSLVVTTLADAGDQAVGGKAENIYFGVLSFGVVLALVGVIALFVIGSTSTSAVLVVSALAGSITWAFVLFIILTVIVWAMGFFIIKLMPMKSLAIVACVLVVIAIFLARLCFYGLQIGLGL